MKHAPVMDVSHLGYSGLHLLKKNDPFMYYSIPGAQNMDEQDLDKMLPTLVLGSNKPSSQDDDVSARRYNRRRSVSDSHLLVRRRSRISYEGYPDVVLKNHLLDQMTELRSHEAKRRRSSYEMEVSKDEESSQKCNSILQKTLMEMFNDTPQEDDEDEESDE